MSKHIDGTLCPPGTHPVAKIGCSGCKFYSTQKGCTDYQGNCLCGYNDRPDGSDVAFAEGAKPRLVLLRKVEGGYADIEPPVWAKSVRGYYGHGRDKQSAWESVRSLTWPMAGAIALFAYEFSSKSAEELNRE